MVAKPTSSSNAKLVEKSKPVDQQRPTIATAAVSSRSGQPKETAEQKVSSCNFLYFITLIFSSISLLDLAYNFIDYTRIFHVSCHVHDVICHGTI